MSKKRTVTIASASDAKGALEQARLSQEWVDAPAKQPTRKRYADSDTDLEKMAEDLFARDALRDDGEGEEAPVADVIAAPDDDLDAVDVPEGQVLKRHKNGGAALHDEKTGRIKKWVRRAARMRESGTFASDTDIQRNKAGKQARRLSGLEYEERVKRRIRGLGASLFQSTGGLTPDREKALLEGYKADRRRRGWKEPDL